MRRLRAKAVRRYFVVVVLADAFLMRMVPSYHDGL